jgi:carbon monoxide dehydrogenase subunit G
MNVSGTLTAPAPPEQLWGALAQPDRLAEALPSVDAASTGDDGTISAVVRPATGLGVTPFRLRLRVDEQQPPRRAVIRGGGTSAQSAVDLAVTLALEPAPGGTEVRWSADVTFRGYLASVGQRVLPDVARTEIERVLTTAAGLAAPAPA